jgi:glycosyltransferase involved in cell wall biosynthesis
MMADMVGRQPKVVLVGPSKRFLSGISYYTYGLAPALAARCDLSVLLIRKLMPARFYPGHTRVGQALSEIALPVGVASFDGLDYFWGPSAIRALRFLRRQRPDVVVLQWWTGTVLHSYLLLSLMARMQGAKVVIEFHESLDPAEQTYRLLAAYVRIVAPWLFRTCSAFVVHSQSDRALVVSSYHVDPGLVTVIPHAVYDHPVKRAIRCAAPDGACQLLFFGLIRRVKGLEDLITAIDLLDDEEALDYWLTIVGETWEHCEPIVAMARSSRHHDRITIMNRYVTDVEADAYFAAADVVVLPYRSSSQSGVLHLAMEYGLPVVATRVGGLAEAAAAYDGADVVEANSPAALLDGIRRARKQIPGSFSYGHHWADSADAYRALFDRLLALPAGSRAGETPPRLGRVA